ncbi:BREX-1 system adenine-specific DNA-methyltransferase PglX [Dissulfurirhabdus thermomarina]|uniref:site-specific DNA-methyltransferase (adenine-specific) n=1 Tax=Dissulfurirhabdus thermomarina TaxID=1765737 RepID=A0A6N9TST8_DISTH|nr:BREX-1 system adenine-specific DNA-methyltransferase PglX [Dissulfurirhabdus thermomarina]NDY41596.1 BREX-1 system adenine-specific DNA-methyltransferase PglX [Dissulfurirhabdus thermomarina]
MSFDKETRNLLAKTVAACRRRLTEDVTDQLRGVFGLHPDGTVLPLEDLTHLSPDQAAAARRLRDLLDHYTAGAAGGERDRRKAAYERMVLEISFTILNRLAALRLCEERGLVVECVRKGTASDGFRLFERISRGALGGRYDTYRIFLECLFDELALDLGVLFDRLTPQAVVFPSERCMEDVLAELNKPELARLWGEDETIGWIYQYFNPAEERKAMREASQAPRNSRELAVRNQFFTPRYVVEFLTDNTLGRIWYEMRRGDTALKEECRYLVRRPNEVFLAPGEKPPSGTEGGSDLPPEELLTQPAWIEHRPKKDPRDLRVLDPACGSGHFLLYAFDLLERIYEEAWADPESPASEVTGRALREEFETLADLRREIPRLIIEHNLHGIDIDPRAVQIAASALWLRAQKTWKNLGLKAAERPRIRRSNIVTAEPMPGEEDMRREFIEALRPKVLGQLTDVVFEKMKLAGEAGSLLKIEEEIRDAVAEAKKQWLEGPKPEQMLLFPESAEPKPEQGRLRFDLTGVTDERFWGQAEDRILEALRDYAERAENGRAGRRRLFAEDAARGFAFVDLCRKRFDVVLMNPPFGDVPGRAKTYISEHYPRAFYDLFGAFVERGITCTTDTGCLGAITSRTGFFLSRMEGWRRSLAFGESKLRLLADLGQGVLDTAMVETAAYVVERNPFSDQPIAFYDVREVVDKEVSLLSAILKGSGKVHLVEGKQLEELPGAPLAYWSPPEFRRLFSQIPSFISAGGEVKQGLASGDDFRFLRLFWEVPLRLIGRDRRWVVFAKGGEFQRYYCDLELVVDWSIGAQETYRLRTTQFPVMLTKNAEKYCFRPALTYPQRTQKGFNVRQLPADSLFGAKGPAIFPPTEEDLWYALALFNSDIAEQLIKMLTCFGSYNEGYVSRLPYPNAAEDIRNDIASLARAIVRNLRKRDSCNEVSHVFISVPRSHESCEIELLKSRRQLERLVRRAYGVLSNESEIPESQDHASTDLFNQDGDSKRLRSKAQDLASYSVGIAFGRWDVRIALDPSLAPKLPDPFDPLPVCPPGMLVGPDGLPAKPGGIVSEAWLRARPDANTLPPDGSVSKPTIPDSEYPLRINWDGILVDDPGFNGNQPHRDDIVRRVREVFDLLWKDKAYEIEQEACGILGVRDLRDWFRKPSGFFQDHLKRYSKSRRKAPIYWPLSTASGSYTIWIYYHRLTDQTLYAAVNKYVEPKIAEVERAAARTEEELKSASGRDAARLTDRLNETRAFLGELRDLRGELLRIAALPYRPDLNDGVVINAAPLHNLFRLRSWAKETEKVWKKLEKGDYDWARMAYTIWPDRVREVCRRDRSIAIAHGLEDLCEVEAPASKKKGGRGRRKREAAG